MRFDVFVSVSAMALALSTAIAATAQTPPQKPRMACRTSAESLCPDEVKAKDRAGVRACLIKNFDKVTPECQAAMKASRARGTEKEDTEPPPPKP